MYPGILGTFKLPLTAVRQGINFFFRIRVLALYLQDLIPSMNRECLCIRMRPFLADVCRYVPSVINIFTIVNDISLPYTKKNISSVILKCQRLPFDMHSCRSEAKAYLVYMYVHAPTYPFRVTRWYRNFLCC
jgi:hypothetical protein